MIIFDFNQVVISNLIEHLDDKKHVEEDIGRHMILNTLRTYVKKYKATHGPEVVIACDSRNYWRKEIFPYYKASRKANREKSDLDWDGIFKCLELVKQELKECSHYKVIEIEGVEADDIIGALAIRNSAHEKVMILSSDKDFVQLQVYPNVEQYSPIMKKEIKSSNPAMQLKELIIRGDVSDGIPNFLSEDKCFVDKVRQKSIYEEKLKVWLNQQPEEFCENEDILKNYKRNESLIDLTKIPEKYVESIIDSYENTKTKTKMQFMNYLVSKRLKNLIEVANEF
jgi:5'-3' exonuclease